MRHTLAKRNSYTGLIVLTVAAVALGWILAYRQTPVPGGSTIAAESVSPVVSGALAVAAYGSDIIFNAGAGNSIKVTLRGDVTTSSIANPISGQPLTLLICQDEEGSRMMNWPPNVRLSGGAVTLSTEPNQCDSVTLLFDGNNWLETARAQQLAISGEVLSGAEDPIPDQPSGRSGAQ